MSKSPVVMSAAEYRVILDRLGLDTTTACRLPGVTKTDSKRWAAGTLVIPGEVAKALRKLIRSGATPADLRSMLDDD